MVPNHRLKRARELRGWSQASVAQLLDTDTTTVSRWERGIFVPAPAFREKLCNLFDTNAEELGLLETNQPQTFWYESKNFSFPSVSLGVLLPISEETTHENVSEGLIASLPLPSWPNRTDTYVYILQSAAYNQRAYSLWKEAYVQVLHGHRTKARQLGEASLAAFERIGHPHARVLREWLIKEALLPCSETETLLPCSEAETESLLPETGTV